MAVHDAGGQNDLHCNSNISAYGIQRVEAMKYAVAKVGFSVFFNDGMILGDFF